MANAAALTVITCGPASLFARGLMVSNGMWAGWLTMWVMLLPALFGLSWLFVTLVGAVRQEKLLRILTAVILGYTAYRTLWFAFLEICYVFGFDVQTADRFSVVLALMVIVVAVALLLLKKLPDQIPNFNALGLALISGAVITVGLIRLGLPAVDRVPFFASRGFRLLCAGIGIGVTSFVASRGLFAKNARQILPFASRWLANSLGALFLAVVGLCLVFMAELRLMPFQELVVLIYTRGLGFFLIAIVLWLAVSWRLKIGAVWALAVVMCAGSVYLGYTASADRRRLEALEEPVKRARSRLFRRDSDAALAGWQEILDVRKAALPDSHELVGEALLGFGEALAGVGRPSEAIDRLNTALEIAESPGSGSILDPSLVRARLVMVHRQVGNVDEADALLEGFEVLDFVKLLERPEESADIVVEVAEGYRLSGRMDDAELLFRETLEAIEAVEFSERKALIRALQGLARILSATGRSDQASAVIDKLQRMVGSSQLPIQLSETYRLRAEIASLGGDFGSAVTWQRRALKLHAENLGKDHPETGSVLGELGAYFLGAGNRADALTACQGAQNILLQNYPAESPEVVKADFELARVLKEVGRNDEAMVLLEGCIEKWRLLFGDEYRLIADALQELAGATAKTGDNDRALDLYAQAQDAYLAGFRDALRGLSGPQQMAALDRIHSTFSEFLLFTAHNRPEDESAIRTCFHGWLQIKGALLEMQRARGEMLARSNSEEGRKLFKELRIVENKLAELWFQGRVDSQGRDEGGALRAQKAVLEQSLHGLLGDSGFWAPTSIVSVEDLQGALPFAAAYVDYCRVRENSGLERYFAFVLTRHGAPRLVDLGPSLTLDGRVVDNLLLIGLGLDGVSGADQVQQRLYATAVRPLEEHLRGSTSLLISPDSLLARMPFSAIKDYSGKYLEDRFKISYLSNGRDVVLWDKPTSSKHSAIIFADPDFDVLPPLKQEPVGDSGSRRSRRTWGRPPFHDVQLERLPGTRKEAEAIVNLLNTRTSLDVLWFTDSDASEDALGFVDSPWLMHFATHGYSIPKVEPTESPYMTPWDGSRRRTRKAAPDDNPLVRAGLAMAGANEAFRRMSPRGVLTLDEIMAMPLVDTEMVVVSACESGIGEAQEGEGVFGVGRAFLAAGSRSVVVTLWAVADEPTAQLMEEFYSRWLAGESKAEALQNARFSLRQAYPSSAIWAPFILVGDPS